MKNKIGIVSGVGPLAGADLLSKVFLYAAQDYQAHQDSQYPDLVLLNHGIAGVDNTAKASKPFQEEILEMVGEVEKMGATCIGVACNTAHMYLEHLPPSSKSKTINLIEAVALEAAKSPKNYLLLTSKTTRSSNLYEPYLTAHSVSFTTVDEKTQETVDNIINHVMAHNLRSATKLAKELLKGLPSKYTGVIAGCTELPLALQSVSNVEIVDSNSVLARALLAAYYQQM
jgi:aspartate racemase